MDLKKICGNDPERLTQMRNAIMGKREYTPEERRMYEIAKSKVGDAVIDIWEARRIMEMEIQAGRCEACEGLSRCMSGGILDVATYTTAYGYAHLMWSKEECARLKATKERIRWLRRRRHANLPEMMEVEMSPNQLKIYEAIIERNEWGLISGECGVGKTYVAMKLGEHYLREGRSVLFANTTEMLWRMRYDSDEMRSLNEVEVLILDDMGSEMKTQIGVEKLYVILDGRYRCEKQVLMTSNYEMVEMCGLYGSGMGVRIGERIRRMGRQYILTR